MPPFLPRALAAFIVLASCAAAAVPAPAGVRAEIDALFRKLQAPGCEFSRNGSWHSGADAQAHLTRKLEYLEGKNLIKTTEDFIALAASTSSSSGKPYLVRCGGGSAAAVESKAWLHEQLKLIRTSPTRSP